MACCPDKCSEVDDGFDGFDENGNPCLYRKSCPYDGLATIFNVDDPLTYYNWRVEVGKEYLPYWIVKYPPRYRELFDQEINLRAFELTGTHDGSMGMICPASKELVFAEKLPYLNFIINDLGGYSSIEVSMQTIDSLNCKEMKVVTRTICAKNFVSRTCIEETSMEMPMRLKPSWNYACLDLNQLVNDAWNAKYLATTKVKINSNVRIRRIYFSDKDYSFDDLPNEFKMTINPLSSTLDEIKNYEQAMKRTASVNKEYQTTDSGKVSNGEKFILPVDLKERKPNSQDDIIQKGFRLSIPSNTEKLDSLIDPIGKSIIDGENITWLYPESQKKLNSQKIRKKLPSLISIGEQMRQEQNQKLKGMGNKDFETSNDLQSFCSYVWRQNSSSSKIGEGGRGEWTKIENSNVEPQTVAKIQNQRRNEGLYDLYTRRMITKKDQKYFGFGDKEEAKFLAGTSNEKLVSRRCIYEEHNKELKSTNEKLSNDLESLKNVNNISEDLENESLLSDKHEIEENSVKQIEVEEMCTLCKCKCKCNCKAMKITAKCKTSVQQDLLRLKFVPAPSKHMRAYEELRGTGAAFLRPFLDGSRKKGIDS